ncbi:MAG: TonB-dependent receptor, partial [Pyrinomonadaceae bacterium]|nr:TonB-dependent receptor [Pyrinomonadaceae bacterium]
MAGTGFIGSNPFSPVDRVETRFQLRDNLTWVTGNHTIKFGGDFNWINVKAKFELNFPGLFNFGQQAGSSLTPNIQVTIPGTPPTVVTVPCDSPIIATSTTPNLRCPAFSPIQSYGLGFPSVFIQGFGDPNSTLRNRPIAFFAQDTWKVFKNFTFNYGIRYDVELTEEKGPTAFRDPLTGITLSTTDVQAAQDALNITQGFPRDTNNWAPRLGFAWDLKGDAKTVVRGAIGMFYDHPLLAVGFNSDIADGSQQQQSTLLPIGGPSPTGLFNAFQVFHGTVIPGVTPGVASSARYLQGFQRFDTSTFTGFGPILPFTLHVSKDFEFPYAVQGNFSVERMLTKNSTLSASYITVNTKHLAHPQDVNNVNTTALVDNFRRFAGRNPNSLAEAAFFSLPTASNAAFTVVVPGLIAVNNATGLRIVSPIASNYFR